MGERTLGQALALADEWRGRESVGEDVYTDLVVLADEVKRLVAGRTSVWVVEQGEYSGRVVSGVYSTEENARLAASTDGDVEEYSLNPGINERNAGLLGFHVVMDKEGNVRGAKESGHLTTGNSFNLGLARPSPPWVYDHVSALVWAKDAQHAIKITNEYRGQVIASGEWDEHQAEFARHSAS